MKKLRKQEGIELSLVRSGEYLQYIVSQLDVVDMDDAVVETAERYCEAVEERDGVARSKVAIAGCSLKAALEETGDDRMVSHYQLAEVTAMNRKTFENNLDYFREKDLLDN